jgi:hypothetical protein
MLQRGMISALAAIVFGLWGFAGPLQSTAPLGQGLFFLAAAFSLISLLLSLFEPVGAPAPAREAPGAAPMAAAMPIPRQGSLASGAVASALLGGPRLEAEPAGIPGLFRPGAADAAVRQETHPQPS